MDTSGLLGIIDAQIERLTKARKLLSGSDNSHIGRGVSRATPGLPKRRRHMSAEARRRISQAQKKRWAAVKRAAKK